MEVDLAKVPSYVRRMCGSSSQFTREECGISSRETCRALPYQDAWRSAIAQQTSLPSCRTCPVRSSSYQVNNIGIKYRVFFLYISFVNTKALNTHLKRSRKQAVVFAMTRESSIVLSFSTLSISVRFSFLANCLLLCSSSIASCASILNKMKRSNPALKKL